VETLTQCRHQLEGANYKVLNRCDHKNLESFQISKVFCRRQASWSDILSAHYFIIEHLEGTKNPADGPTGWSDYEIGYERPVARLLATAPVESYDDLMPVIIAAQASASVVVDISAKLVDRPAADRTDSAVKEIQWEVITGALTCGGRTYVPAVNSLCRQGISLFHDNPESGHFEAPMTTERVSSDFHWPTMDSPVHKNGSGCKVCHRIKASQHARHGMNIPLEAPLQPWQGVTMDFLTDLPESIASAYTMIPFIVDRLIRMAIYLPWRKDIDSP